MVRFVALFSRVREAPGRGLVELQLMLEQAMTVPPRLNPVTISETVTVTGLP
jgi:hypothetical protein